jgi:hypothetical protein
MVTVSKKTGGWVQNRWNTVAKNASEEARKLEKALGLMDRPPSRPRGANRFKPRVIKAADRWLNRQGKKNDD